MKTFTKYLLYINFILLYIHYVTILATKKEWKKARPTETRTSKETYLSGRVIVFPSTDTESPLCSAWSSETLFLPKKEEANEANTDVEWITKKC